MARAESPRVNFAGPPGQQALLVNGEPARYDPKAERLIARLHLSEGLRQVARDAVAVDMARGISTRAAVEGWYRKHSMPRDKSQHMREVH